MSEILIVDDEPAIGWSLRELLTGEGHAVTLATTVADAIAACRRRPPDTILLDVRLPGRDGISAIPELRALAPSAPVIVMTAFGDLDTAVRTVAAGAFDYLIKPFDLEQVTAVVARALADRGHAAAAVAPSEEAAAPGAVEGELFGQTRPGLFELAAGGTLFLDEIGAAPLDVQAKLLRTLETAAFTRLGSAAPTAADVRVIAATDQDLAAAVGAGTFRADLYERLRVLSIDVPPLAARPEDIEPLARHFLARHSGRQPQPAARPAIATECFQALRDHPWPGNVRELKHAIEYAAVIARGGTLRPEHLPAPPGVAAATAATPLAAATAALTAATKEWAAAARHEFGELAEPDLHHRASTAVEAALLREVLAHTGGNRTAAAKLLGLDRATLRTKLRHLGLDD